MYVLTKDKEHKQLLIDLLPTIEVCMRRGWGGARAGGGGFMYVLTKDKEQKQLLIDLLPTIEVCMTVCV